MAIGISGASGQLGAATIRELGERRPGQPIVAISRTPEVVTGADESRYGDYDFPQTLIEAYRGIERLLLIPSADLRPGHRTRQNLAAIDAAQRAGVDHVAIISSVGTRHAEEPEIWASYFAAEQHLFAKGGKWSVLRAGYYAESFVDEARNSLPGGIIAGLADSKIAPVSREDLAASAAGLLTRGGYEGAILNITGPKALSGVQRADLVARISGKPVRHLTLSEPELRAALAQTNLPEDLLNLIVSIQHAFASGGFDIVTGDVARLAGRPPRALEEILRDLL